VVLGGGHDLANLVPACKRCNYSRDATVGNRLCSQRVVTVARAWHTSRRW